MLGLCRHRRRLPAKRGEGAWSGLSAPDSPRCCLLGFRRTLRPSRTTLFLQLSRDMELLGGWGRDGGVSQSPCARAFALVESALSAGPSLS